MWAVARGVGLQKREQRIGVLSPFSDSEIRPKQMDSGFVSCEQFNLWWLNYTEPLLEFKMGILPSENQFIDETSM